MHSPPSMSGLLTQASGWPRVCYNIGPASTATTCHGVESAWKHILDRVFAGINALSNFEKVLLVCLADAAEPSSVQQLRSRALQLCSQLQRAALLAAPAQQPSAGSMWPSDSFSTSSAALTQSSMGRSAVSSTGRTVLSLLESSREVLEQMPQVGGGSCWLPSQSDICVNLHLMSIIQRSGIICCHDSLMAPMSIPRARHRRVVHHVL